MGILFSRLWQAFGEKEARILVLGLDNAGKTTILYRLQVGTVVSTIPTIGFNVETLTYGNIKFQVWIWAARPPSGRTGGGAAEHAGSDLRGGQLGPERVGTSRQEFHAILEEELAEAAVLVFANKQGVPARSPSCRSPRARTRRDQNRQWAIFKTSAKGEGLWEGMEWLSNTLRRDRDVGVARSES